MAIHTHTDATPPLCGPPGLIPCIKGEKKTLLSRRSDTERGKIRPVIILTNKTDWSLWIGRFGFGFGFGWVGFNRPITPTPTKKMDYNRASREKKIPDSEG